MPQWIGAFRARIPLAQFQSGCDGVGAGALSYRGRRWRLDDGGTCLDIDPVQFGLNDLDPDRAYWLAIERNGARLSVSYLAPRDWGPEQNLLASRAEKLTGRWRIAADVRRHFWSRGFTEVETPIRVMTPAVEPHLQAIASRPLFLRTSPELHLKRLLAAGFEPIFELGPAFRDEPRSRTHREAFTMLEWYRLFADLDSLVEDVSQLLHALSEASTDPSYFRRRPEVISVEDLFRTRLGLDLVAGDAGIQRMLAYCRATDMHTAVDDDWDDLFFRIFLNRLERQLGLERPIIVTDYPASQSALAKCAPTDPTRFPTCYRFEVFIKGLELGNAFYELCDPKEQRRRIQDARCVQRESGRDVYPIDESFLGALRSGLPPCAGIAIGFDRLVMSLLGADHIDDVLPF